MAKVSVIVPIYKVEKYLCQCIDSILNQTLEDIEVILVDEGDLDACRAIIDMYEFGAKKDSRVKSIHEKNGGYGASVNKGFDIATGEYISIIESDDFIAPEMYEEMYNYAKKLDADVVKTTYNEYWDATKTTPEIIKLYPGTAKIKHIPENKLFSIEEYPVLVAIHPSIWAGLYKTSYIREKNIRCIEARGAGYVDNHFRLQTFCQTDKIAYLNKAYNYYRLSNPDASQANYDLGAFIQRWNDVHKMFAEKFPEKWESLAPYCIKEEWINTYWRIISQGFVITEKQYEILIENFSKTTAEQIASSKELLRKDAIKLLKFKKDPTLFKNYIEENVITEFEKIRYRTIYKVSLFGVPLLKIRAKLDYKYRILLFGLIPFMTIRRKV